eukprot:14228081-Alexandrium_andersonii.AAC.1
MPSNLEAACLHFLRRVEAGPREAPPPERAVGPRGRDGRSKEAGESARGLPCSPCGLQSAELQEVLEELDVGTSALCRGVEARLDPVAPRE